MAEQSHLSIGEVLSLLQDEFPDVTISKIRFLESQGLLDPERTPSGYRKFYEADIEKLRWVLTEQRDHFLPLKVIRDRLTENDGAVPAAANPAGSPPVVPAAAPEPTQPVWMADHARRAGHIEVPAAAAAPPQARAASATTPTPTPLPLDTGPTTATFTLEELQAATRLTAAQVRSLEQFGLLTSRQVGPDLVYDAESVVIGQKAAGFFAHGVEARHLRMYLVASGREAGLLEQVVTPMLKQRNPTARRQAVDLLGELMELGAGLHASLLRQALQDYLSPPG